MISDYENRIIIIKTGLLTELFRIDRTFETFIQQVKVILVYRLYDSLKELI